LKKNERGLDEYPGQIFVDVIVFPMQVEGTADRHIGEEVFILCDDPEAYGIHLN